ncbi:TauD/TfdA family dioxygenase [Williamsia sp. D3]|uniref:TauD/TfdA dioxygenase family protein n=1 Tax=Williamsia sp. D3 TaxID=1313067 RepID=UPI0004068C6F|nr:TauD/TfdA family dioxygenase [Williamsia sp. D3]
MTTLIESRQSISNRLSVEPIAGYLGAEVSGVDLVDELDAVTQRELRDVLFEYKVLFFRDQVIDHAQQIRFTSYFGPVTDAHPLGYTDKSPAGYPQVLEVDSRTYASRGGSRRYSYANFWHQDVTALVNPPAVTVLRAELVPEVGGDTTWADLGAAYDNLPASLQRFLEGLYAENRFGGREKRWEKGSEAESLTQQTPIISEHPVIRVHPVTGQKLIYVNPGFTSRILGVSPSQSDRILDLLFEEITDPAITVRVRWTPDSIGVWDNRATIHQAPTDLDHLDVVRVLHRTTVEGDVPEGVGGRRSRSVSGEPFFAKKSA